MKPLMQISEKIFVMYFLSFVHENLFFLSCLAASQNTHMQILKNIYSAFFFHKWTVSCDFHKTNERYWIIYFKELKIDESNQIRQEDIVKIVIRSKIK